LPASVSRPELATQQKGVCNEPPIADWFRIAMRLQHAKQTASGLVTDTPGRMQAKAAIVVEVERCTGRSGMAKLKAPGTP
jgi:hypothetical protein